MQRDLRVRTKRLGDGQEARSIRFVLSTSIEDRAGDTIDQNGWRLDRFKENPVLLWGHESRKPPIGVVRNLGVVNGRLEGDAVFASAETYEFADTVYRLCKDGFINAGSVGFSAVRYEINRDTGGLNFKEQELHEFSIVSVPCNPQALAVRSLDSETAERVAKGWTSDYEAARAELLDGAPLVKLRMNQRRAAVTASQFKLNCTE